MFQLGTISSGTLRTEDLLERFAEEAARLVRGNPDLERRYLDLIEQAEDAGLWSAINNDFTPMEIWEKASEIVNDLSDALNDLCPPYVYFGNTEGDGAEFGFWLDYEAVEIINGPWQAGDYASDGVWSEATETLHDAGTGETIARV